MVKTVDMSESPAYGFRMNSNDLGLGELLDVALCDEIELVGALVAAAAGCSDRMCSGELDSVLGVSPRR